jgi:tol-pal system protein YbgF
MSWRRQDWYVAPKARVRQGRPILLFIAFCTHLAYTRASLPMENGPMLRSGFPFLCCVIFLSGCSKPQLPDPRVGELEARVRHSEEQLAVAHAEMAGLQQRIQSLQDRLAETESVLREPSPPPAQPEPRQSAPSAPAPSKPTPRHKEPRTAPQGSKQYEQVLSSFLEGGDPREARKGFSTFLQLHQGHRLEPNARYWLAETYYDEQRFPEAILAFKEVVNRFPAHAKAADALLKIGYSYRALGDEVNARFHLRLLLADYPDTEAAQKAGKSLSLQGG